jgi:hypothetical protein
VTVSLLIAAVMKPLQGLLAASPGGTACAEEGPGQDTQQGLIWISQRKPLVRVSGSHARSIRNAVADSRMLTMFWAHACMCYALAHCERSQLTLHAFSADFAPHAVVAWPGHTSRNAGAILNGAAPACVCAHLHTQASTQMP